MSAVLIDGRLVHYEAVGRGKPIVFLHGWLGSWRYWMYTMEESSVGHRSYALDLWGFGDTDAADAQYGLDDFVAQAEAFVEDLGLWRVNLIGHALGAAVAIRFASLFPQRVERVMAVSLPLAGDQINRRALAGGSGGMLGLFGGYRWQEYEEIAGELKKTKPIAISASVDSVGAFDWQQTLSMLSMPVLLVNGRKDPIVRPLTEEMLNGSGRNTRLIEFEDSRHFPMLEERSKFNRLLKDFLAAGHDLRSLELREEWRRRTR
jgi:pimeloyl-ACP methyl ester carboxylesterase